MEGEANQGYNRAKRCIYENSAVCSSCDGLSGNFAIVVWRSFHPALPSSAFRVSLPILEEMAVPFRMESFAVMGWMGAEEGWSGMGGRERV